uniref:40S ribosomal protein S6 n=1 Tax=Chromera velia CCMP2878 TaxID=1169474 RepID=A0A0G4HNM8_9ALVE|eukprot:Cvel_7629.t1-p1 / transcript=Cvel_7629.t1 / gene=Cvel_7629 / organism=Chromera_velia_CCMP2878 / gene_product=40S ribosomal protein S6, putative / transcript_product=40S ribosomal protein S6, putative / location=Cvel_scaffold403:5868-9199(-) / protein_length=248 / sequence_SO=supercontig / SO=protein_coding / is_pseudo=false
MKINIANPAVNLQKTIEVDDDRKLLPFFEKRMGAEVVGDSLGDEFKGYLFKISGGNDKQGFPMMQGVLLNTRTRLLFKPGMKTYRARRKGMYKRKSVRGCIVGPDLSVMNLVLLKKGETDVPGLTDDPKPNRLGPKRANHIRKLFGLTKEDDVRKYVVRREVQGKKKAYTKAPKIQRLVTASRLQRKRRLANEKVAKAKASSEEFQKYKKVLSEWQHEQKEKRAAELAKKKAGVAKKIAKKAAEKGSA